MSEARLCATEFIVTKPKTKMPKRSPATGLTPAAGMLLAVPKSFTAKDLAFWVAHGVNYLLSDEATGTWAPLFPALYGTPSKVPTLAEVQQALLDRYSHLAKWPAAGKTALAWTVQGRDHVYVYYKEALRRLSAAHGIDLPELEAKAREPQNPLVWALFSYMKDHVRRDPRVKPPKKPKAMPDEPQ